MDVANIHASCVMLAKGAPFPTGLYYSGVLLLGDSGAGKSDLALRLIAQGCLLVSDDRTELFIEGGKLKARAPAALAGLIEVRGVGILSLSYEKAAEVTLAVQLVAGDAVPRLPERERYVLPPPLALPEAACPPLIRLNAFEASATAKLRWAMMAFQQNLFRDTPNQ
jgi:serine kinase of HPr protein (carbohydrate metabolism regulator)